MSTTPTESPALRAYRERIALACLRPVVHDANNALGIVSMQAELILAPDGHPTEKASEFTSRISGMAMDCSALLEGLARLARPLPPHAGPFDPGKQLVRTIDLYRHNLLRAGIQLAEPGISTDRLGIGHPALVSAALAGGLIRAEAGLDGKAGKALRSRVTLDGPRVLISLSHPAITESEPLSPTDPRQIQDEFAAMDMALEVTAESVTVSLEAAPEGSSPPL